MRIVRVVFCFCVLLVGALAAFQPSTVLAVRPVLEEGEKIVIVESPFPAVEGESGGTFEFDLELLYATYQGTGSPLYFDLVVTGPRYWSFYMTSWKDRDIHISSIRLDPGLSTPESIWVVATSPYWLTPESGEYTITLDVISEELESSIELTAIIPDTYILDFVPTTERYNTSVTAGRDNYFSMEVYNDGTATLNDIVFSSDKPEGWTIEFTPDQVDSLNPVTSQTIEVNIKPPSRTIAGDYRIFLTAGGGQTKTSDVQIRVTVETPTVWGWVGVGIIVAVIVGMVYVFIRFSRR